MKAFFALVLAGMLFSVLIVSSACVYEPSFGVKKGDWIDYDISMAGPPLDTWRNLTWYRIDILEVDGGWVEVNKTALSVNDALSSSVWNFNLTGGQVQGWVIIPANLGVGDFFFDAAKSANVTIEGEEQKTLLGASRTVTHASDPGKVHKEWDKATGIYVHAIAYTSTFTVITNAIATNLWGPQTLEQNQIKYYQLAAAAIIVLALLILFLSVFFAKKAIDVCCPSQGKNATLTIIVLVMLV